VATLTNDRTLRILEERDPPREEIDAPPTRRAMLELAEKLRYSELARYRAEELLESRNDEIIEISETLRLSTIQLTSVKNQIDALTRTELDLRLALERETQTAATAKALQQSDATHLKMRIAEINSLQDELTARNQVVDSLRSHLEETQKTTSQTASLLITAEANRTTAERLQVALKNELIELQQEISRQHNSQTAAEHQRSMLEGKIVELQQEILHQRNTQTAAENLQKTLEGRTIQLQQEISDQHKTQAIAEQLRSTLELKIAELQQEVMRQCNTQIAAENLRNTLEKKIIELQQTTLRQSKDQATAEILRTNLQKQITELQQEILHHRKAQTATESRRNDLENKITELQQKVLHQQNNHAAAELLRNTLEQRIAKLQQEAVRQHDTKAVAEHLRNILEKKITELQQETLRQRSALIAAERSAASARQTLSFQLGHGLIIAWKSWSGLRRLPSLLLDLRRQAKEGRFRHGKLSAATGNHQNFSNTKLSSEIENVFRVDGIATAETQWQAAAQQTPPIDWANAGTHLARLVLPVDRDAGCRLARAAFQSDPRPFRRKWLAFTLFDAGFIREAHELLTSLPAEYELKPSERNKIDWIAGAFRLLANCPELSPRNHGVLPHADGPILYVAASALPYHVSGYTLRTHAVLSALTALGNEVICVTRPGYPNDRSDARQQLSEFQQVIDGVRYESLPGPHRRKLPADQYFAEASETIEARARTLGARVIHAASNYENALPALMAARRIGVPFVYEVRGLWEYTAASKKPGWETTEGFALDRKLETFTASEADHVLTLTQALADELIRRGVRREHITLVPNAIDPKVFTPVARDTLLANELGLPEDAFVVGYIGSVVGYEGLDDLVSAVAQLAPELPQLRLLVVGDGDALPSLRQQIASLELSGHAILTGRVDPKETQRYYSLLQVVALPRKPYTVCQLVSPLKPLEAMAMRVPVVVSDVHALKEMVEDGVCGLVFPAGRVDALADSLRKLITSPQLRQQLADAAYRDVTTKRTWAQIASKLAQIYPKTGAETVPPAAIALAAHPAPVKPEPVRREAPPPATAISLVTIEPLPLPPGKNAMSAEEKEQFNARLTAALAQGSVPAVIELVRQQTSGRSDKFASFCKLRAASVLLASGILQQAYALTEEALQLAPGAATLRGAARLYYNAAQFDRAGELVQMLEASLPSVSDADRRFIAEVRGRQQLARWAKAPAAQRSLPVQPRRVLNILAFSLPYTSVGYATRSHGLAQGIQQAEWDIRPYTRVGFPFDFKPELQGQTLPEQDEIDGLTYRRVFDAQRSAMNEVEYLLASVAHYERIIAQEQPEIVHAASNYVTALPALIAARRLGVPFVYEVRGFWEVTRSSRDEAFENTPKYRFMQFFEGLVARQADRVITITTAMKEELIGRGVLAENIAIAFNSVDPERFVPRPRDTALAQRLGLPSGIPIIGYIGSFVDYEGLDDLVEAAHRLKQTGYDFRLLLVGDGAIFEALKTQIDTLQLTDRVLLTGRVPHDEVENYYSLVDIAPFPRKPWEVCELVSPLKPFEAMALQKAVVVSSTRALNEIVTNGSNGLVFEKGNVESLRAALQAVITDPQLRISLGHRARTWVEEQRSWKVAGVAVTACYAEAINSPSSPRSHRTQ